MEAWSETFALMGLLVLAFPVWKANRVARRHHRIENSNVAEGSNPIFDSARKALTKRIKPDEWTAGDQIVLYVGYALALSGQLLTLFY